ncbi:MAG: hypothetical protein ABIT58_10515 [Ferruginibacter sp.]
MKLLFTAFALFICALSFGQVPNKFNYQAVARNGQGQALINSHISVRVSILDGSATAGVVYEETRTLTTNQLGLFTFPIGGSGAQSTTGNFATIDWSTGSKFIKVEADPLGGNNFIALGNTELLSVPYALYAVNGKVGPQGPAGAAGIQGPAGAAGPAGLTTVTTASPVTGTGTSASPITFIAGTADKQVLLWNAASSTWILGVIPDFFTAAGNDIYNNNTGNIGIGTNTAPDASAKLEIKATNKGLLIPRVSLTAANDAATVPLPAQYLMVFNTNTAPAAGLTGQGLYVNLSTPASPAWSRIGAASLSGNGTANILPRWTGTGQSLTNSQLFDDSSKVGINTITPHARLDVSGHAAIDTVLSPDLNGNSRITGMFRDSTSFAGNNVGLFTSTGNGRRNVGLYTTSTQSNNLGAGYQGIIIDDYDNALVTSGTVEGIYSDVGNNGTGGATGIDNFVTSQGYSVGARNVVHGSSSRAIYAIALAETGDAYGMTIISDANFGTGRSSAGSFYANAEDVNDNLVTGVIASADSYSALPGHQVGLYANSYSEEIPAEVTDLDGLANPAGQFIADGGSGQGLYAEATGTGFNSAYFAGLTGEGVKAIAKSNANANNIGLFSKGGNATGYNWGTYSIIDGTPGDSVNIAVLGVDNMNTTNSFAAAFIGKVAIQDGTEGNGKVFTSDSMGKGSWQDLATPAVYISLRDLSTATISIPAMTQVAISQWLAGDEAGGANYNTATGAYTIPVTGYYSVDVNVAWLSGASPVAGLAGSNTNLIMKVDNVEKAHSTGANIMLNQALPDNQLHYSGVFTAGQVIQFFIYQPGPGANSLLSSGSRFSINLIHKQ